MTVEGTFFVLRLEEIIVDGAGSFPVPPSAPGLRTGNIIIGSGTTINFLPAGVLSSLVQEVSRVVSLPKATDSDGTLPLCFTVTGEPDRQKLPVIEPSDAVSRLVPDTFEYLMELRVGTPPFSILAVVGTGSDHIWANCVPCTKCYRQTAPLFDPRKSSSYRTLPCTSDLCMAFSDKACGSGSPCEYHYAYQDGSNIDGARPRHRGPHFRLLRGVSARLLQYRLRLQLPEQRLLQQPRRRFGRARRRSSLSRTQASSKVIFGSAGVVARSMVTTPMTVEHTFFVLRLEEIIVDGADSVTVPSSAPGLTTGNIIIDSSTTLNYLPTGVLSILVEQVSRVVSLPKATDPKGVMPLCFTVTGESDRQKLPFITFKFAGEASLRLSPTSIFMDEFSFAGDVVCLAVANSGSGLPIFGNWAQQNLYVGYDFDIPAVTFASADCTKL
ncbi:hypothetical protein ZIOFF_013160 [Zingiber officinale]|uniref:Peptidase A1 domain-containing protein n=1 Tax=Zingiber officinale TaxID=94328 RepID=A0A8J5LPU6_ZINOF|nr:hypothetical protein ZIOFF_013160 [Zingiber officinale]